MILRKRVLPTRALLCAALLLLLFANNTFADDESGPVPTDKALHASFSLVIGMAAYDFYRKNTSLTANQAKLAAFVSTLAIGAAKEFSDEKFDWGDMAANGVGAGIGIMIEF